MIANFRKSSLALAVVAAVCAGSAIAATPNNSLVSVAHVTTLQHGDAVTGPLAATHPVHVSVALKLRNRDVLDAFLNNNAKHPIGAKPMSHAQFVANHMPTQAQAQAVVAYLSSMGYKNIVVAPNRLLVSADGTAGMAQRAFSTTLATVMTHDGRTAFGNTDEVRIPASLQNNVMAVLGLQTVNQAHTFIQRRAKTAAVHTDDVMSHNPTEFSSIYSATGVATAAGVTVGIFAIGDVSPAISDLNIFTTSNGLAAVTTQVVSSNGGGTDVSGTDEWDLDSQDIVGMGGGQVGSLVFYNTPSFSDSDLSANFNTIVSANATQIINASFGGCELGAEESGLAAATDQILAVADAQGQTFSISTGDHGADECGDGGVTPSWPADSPYAIAVAGTTLDASKTTWASEVVWGGSGGSPSTFEPKPSWQELLVPGKFRGVADVAFDADPNSGATVVFNGVATPNFGGTSLAAPLFSAEWARVIAVKGTDFGFAGPLIYALPQADFHDVTTGNNFGESAKVGYDFASGRGSVILSSAINDIGHPIGNPPVPGFSYATQGLTVHLTDTSTDSDGTVNYHFWDFGDGSAISRQVNPIHSYIGAGSYNVTETIADNDLNVAHITQAVAVIPGGGARQRIQNTGFETGASPWLWSTFNAFPNDNAAEPPRAGQWDAWLGGEGKAHTDFISQKVFIHAGKTTANLNFWLHVDTAEISKTRQFDKMTVGVYTTSGTLLGTVASFSNLDAATGYVQHTYNLAAYAGQTVVVKFAATEDATLQTSFVIDDVTLLEN